MVAFLIIILLMPLILSRVCVNRVETLMGRIKEHFVGQADGVIIYCTRSIRDETSRMETVYGKGKDQLPVVKD